MNNDRSMLYTDLNTSFKQNQNPFQTIILPCDKEYTQLALGSCSYFLLTESPSDVDIYISLNPEFKNAIKIDNRTTGFKIDDVFSKEGVPAIVKNVYLWTKGITRLTDNQGNLKSLHIIVSSVAGFEILNNSSINSIDSIGQIGRIDGLVGYPNGAKTICDIIIPERKYAIQPGLYMWNKSKTYEIDFSKLIKPNENYIISCQGLIDPELTYLLYVNTVPSLPRHINMHFHAGIILPNTTKLDIPPNKMFSLMSTTFTSAYNNPGGGWAMAATSLLNEKTYQFSGKFIKENFLNSDGIATFTAEITQHLGNDVSTETTDTTNTKATYQIAAYRVG